eukprot:scaffold104111_cov65-Attheya_sp.AAC.5
MSSKSSDFAGLFYTVVLSQAYLAVSPPHCSGCSCQSMGVHLKSASPDPSIQARCQVFHACSFVYVCHQVWQCQKVELPVDIINNR